MEYQIRELNSIHVIDLSGDFDLYEATEFKTRLKTWISSGVKKMVVNLKDLRYIDSSGIGALISGLQQMFKVGGKFKIAGLHQDLRRSFELANLVRLFEIYSTDDDAIKSF